MRPLAFLKCLGKAALKLAANLAGFAAQVEVVVREVAAGQPAEKQRRLSGSLQQVPEVLRRSFRRPDDQQGQSVPPGLRVRQASDLASLLSAHPTEAASPPAARPQVTLHFTEGQRKGQAEVSTEPTVLLFGRGQNCEPRLPQKGHKLVPRNHCLIKINPPDVRLRDLGGRAVIMVRASRGEPPGPPRRNGRTRFPSGSEIPDCQPGSPS